LEKAYYSPGAACALRGIVDRKIWMARSVIVVEDRPEGSVLLLLPGAGCAFPEGYWTWHLHAGSHPLTRWQEARGDPIALREFLWTRNRVLIFLEPGKYYSPYLFWEHATGRFGGCYINFELPFRRSPCGFDSLDLDLDMVIEPDHTWYWKDEDEYQTGIHEGGIRPEWAAGVEASKSEVLERIRSRTLPLDGAWRNWQPDPAWLPPQLPEGWREV
jgi:hypothetical protein